jgi:RNA polymerase sigma-70 factor, ECF subfamily
LLVEQVQEPDYALLRGSTTELASDEELVRRARGGHVRSFEELMRRYEARLLRFLQHRGVTEDAEDLVQETFVRVYTNLQRYQSRWRFVTWLFTIARRLSINHHQRFRIDADSSVIQSAQSPMPGPAQLAAERDNRQHLWSVAARVLSEEEMTAIWLYYVEDVPPREIGAVLGRSWLAVRSIMYRARRKLSPWLSEAES